MSIKRLRFMFLGVGAALLLAIGLLVSRALASVADERELRHQAVAERIFDEMERELTELVAMEENRPFEHYLYYFYSTSSNRLERSPLAGEPEAPYVVGYFQVDPGGDVSSPHFNERMTEGGTPAQKEAARRVVGLVRAARTAAVDEPPPAGYGETPTQLPGTTQSVTSKDERLVEAEAAPPSPSGYLDSINELNRGALERQQRGSKLSQVATPNVAELMERESLDLGPVDVVLSSMVGRPAGPGHLMLVRHASANGVAFEQGLVIEVEPLVAWLQENVLAPGGLAARAEVSTSPPGRLPSDDALSRAAGARRYRRRFAEPFAEVASVLTLAPLPEATGVVYLYWLSALLGLAVLAGLFGLYRMVAVTVSFAERQKNFVSSVSHELKTPLTAIRMYGEMLRDGIAGDEEKKHQYYEVITSESERLTRLVGNVLELSRLEQRQPRLRPAPGALAPVLDEIVNVLGPHARSEGFALEVEAEDDLPQAVFDPDGLLQVLFNLVDNALKYAAEPSSSDILLRARRHDGADGAEVVVSVSDGGPGVSREHLAHVFEPFYRGESEMTRTSKGTGIGLALVRGLVEEMGGRVACANRDGGGFEVSIYLRGAREV